MATKTAPAPAEQAEGEQPAKGGKKKLIIIVAVVVLLGGAYMTVGKSLLGGGKKGKPQPGQILSIDPMTLNLSDGHLLQVGLGLQLAAGVDPTKAQDDEAKAQDAAINVLSRYTMAQLLNPAGRQAAQQALTNDVVSLYTTKGQEEVLTVYFTDFVMQ